MRFYSWIILAVLFVARAALGYQFQSIASVAPFLVRSLHVNYAEMGSLIGIYMLPGGDVFDGRLLRLCDAAGRDRLSRAGQVEEIQGKPETDRQRGKPCPAADDAKPTGDRLGLHLGNLQHRAAGVLQLYATAAGG